jgi:isoquinoline 1-oxidoreductase subunit beta
MSADTTTDNTAALKPKRRIGRRLFLITAALVGGGVAVGAGFIANRRRQHRAYVLPTPKDGASFGAWLTINPQGHITAYCPHQEMGQGIMSLTASLIAEELDADPAHMRVEQAPVLPVYSNATMLLDGLPFKADDHGAVASAVRSTTRNIIEAFGINATGGSTGTRNIIDAVQRSAAAARAMLLAAAADKLKVAVGELSIDKSLIRHTSGRSVSFADVAVFAGTLASAAATQNVQPKPRSAYKMLGKTGMPRVDVPSKVDGTAQFGVDVRLPGQLYAAVRQCPVFGGTVKSVNFGDKPQGIQATVQGRDFIAAVGTSWYAAKQYLAQVAVTWDDGALATLSSEGVFKRYTQALDTTPGDVQETRGDVSKVPAGGTLVQAEYRAPFLAHATMEPMNATVWFKGSGSDMTCDIWVGNQGPLLVKWGLASAAGVKSENFNVHTPMLGGGFGRRLEMDVMKQAIACAKAVPGVPVQTLWSREEDMQHDTYRPAAMARFTAQLGADGLPTSVRAHVVCPSVTTQASKRLIGQGGGPDKTNVDGIVGLPYHLPNLDVRHSMVDTGVPVGFWRSVGHSQNAFFAETFIDECATAAKQDPLAYRLALLRAAVKANPNDQLAARCIKLLEAVAAKAGWGQPLAPVDGAKVGRGIALAESFRSIVAEVAEVVVTADHKVRVRRVVAAVDCGFAVDPVNVVAQLRSGVHFGLAAALHGRIDIEAGRAKQSNYTDYRMMTLADAPAVDVIIVPSDAELGGIGEVGTPPIAPAVVNAVRAATGRVVRELPLMA